MDKVTRQCPQTTTFLKRKESWSGVEPRSFHLPALLLGQTGSQVSHTSHSFIYIYLHTDRHTTQFHTHTTSHSYTNTYTSKSQKWQPSEKPRNYQFCETAPLIYSSSLHPLHQACRKAQPKACQKGPFSRSARTKGSLMPWAHWPLKPVDVLIVSSHLVLDGFVTTEAVLDVGDDSEVMLNFGRAAKLNRKRQLCSSARSPFEICSFLSCKSALWSICVCWV